MSDQLGPGSDHPASPAAAAPTIPLPLGPGDDDPRSPAVVSAPSARAPLAPGDADGENPDDAFHFIAQPALGPGDAQTAPRHVVRIPKKTPATTPDAANVHEKE